MKNYVIVALLAFLLGCFSSSPKIVKDIISGADSIKDILELELTRIDSEIHSITKVYKVEDVKTKDIIYSSDVIKAGIGDIFGCTSKKPESKTETKVKPSITQLPVVPPMKVVKIKVVPIAPKVVKPSIISVKTESVLVNGKITLNKWKVKLNKEGLDKVKKGAKVRIFIAYCYYEFDNIEKDGTVTFNIEWHPPLSRAEGKIGVSLFMQTNNPEIGSGTQYCSIITKI